jgi:FkbM family methyltransferase
MNNEHRAAQALLRAWPFPRGAGRIADRCFSKLSFKQAVATVRTTDRFDMTVRPNDLIGRHIYLTGEFDRTIVELLCNFSQRDDVLVDIGANIGYVSTCFLKNVPDSSVIAVEPVPLNLSLLTINLNRFGRYQIYPFALSNQDGETWFEVDSANMGGSHMVHGRGDRTTKVETRAANRLFTDLNIEKVDLMKLDAEGAEEIILATCANQLESLQPRAIVFEDSQNSVVADSGVRSTLNRVGYDIFGVKKALRRLDLINVNINRSVSFSDYIAISRIREIPPLAISTYGLNKNAGFVR